MYLYIMGIKSIVKIILVLILTISCTSSYHIQKNYSKGGYISWHGKFKKKYGKSGFTN